MIVFLAYHAIKHYRFVKLTKRWSVGVTDKDALSLFADLKDEMGIVKRIELYVCPCSGSPAMIGFVNPRIFLPAAGLSHDELSFILKHELVHHKRKDLLYKYLVLMAAAVHWFNPVVRLMAKAIAASCEISCDAEVVRNTDADTRRFYSEAIIGAARYQSKLKTALSTNFYGGKKGMKNRISSIMDAGKKKAGFTVVCAALIATVGTGFAVAANAKTEPLFMSAVTTASSSDDVRIDNADVYAKYAEFGLTCNKATGALFYKNEIVRVFEDWYSLGENMFSGISNFNPEGTIDVQAVRDFSNIIRNADGSHDPSGKLTDLKASAQAEFDARDLGEYLNPAQGGVTSAGTDTAYDSAPAVNSTTYAIEMESILQSHGVTFAERFLKYKDYEITFDENSVNGGIGNVFYQDRLVKKFADITPGGGAFTLSSSDGGEITVITVYDKSGKLTGVKVAED